MIKEDAMHIALLSDLHGNLPAAEAVLQKIKTFHPDRILSLGDQINLGPCPRETLDLLQSEGVTCLHGNHERYVLSAMDGHPGYAGANFKWVRRQAQMFTREEITLPKAIEIGNVIFTHALPQDDRFPVFDENLAVAKLSEMTFDKPTHIICGHGHNPTHIAIPNLTLDSIGSAGCMDDGVPGAAPFAMLTVDHRGTFLRPYYVSYDTSGLKDLFARGGAKDACPVMARIAHLQMTTNRDYLVPFVNMALALSKKRGESCVSEDTWQDTDAAYPWPDGQTTDAFWRG